MLSRSSSTHLLSSLFFFLTCLFTVVYAPPPRQRGRPALPIDVFRVGGEGGTEVQQVQWGTQAYKLLLLLRNPGASLPSEVFLVDNLAHDRSRDAAGVLAQGIFVSTSILDTDRGTYYRFESYKAASRSGEARFVASPGFDMGRANPARQRTLVGVLWSKKAKEAFLGLLEGVVEGMGGVDEEEGGGAGGGGERVGEEVGGGIREGGDEGDEDDDIDNGEEEGVLTAYGEPASWAFDVVTGGVRQGFIDPAAAFAYYGMNVDRVMD